MPDLSLLESPPMRDKDLPRLRHLKQSNLAQLLCDPRNKGSASPHPSDDNPPEDPTSQAMRQCKCKCAPAFSFFFFFLLLFFCLGASFTYFVRTCLVWCCGRVCAWADIGTRDDLQGSSKDQPCMPCLCSTTPVSFSLSVRETLMPVIIIKSRIRDPELCNRPICCGLFSGPTAKSWWSSNCSKCSCRMVAGLHGQDICSVSLALDFHMPSDVHQLGYFS